MVNRTASVEPTSHKMEQRIEKIRTRWRELQERSHHCIRLSERVEVAAQIKLEVEEEMGNLFAEEGSHLKSGAVIICPSTINYHLSSTPSSPIKLHLDEDEELDSADYRNLVQELEALDQIFSEVNDDVDTSNDLPTVDSPNSFLKSKKNLSHILAGKKNGAVLGMDGMLGVVAGQAGLKEGVCVGRYWGYELGYEAWGGSVDESPLERLVSPYAAGHVDPANRATHKLYREFGNCPVFYINEPPPGYGANCGWLLPRTELIDSKCKWQKASAKYLSVCTIKPVAPGEELFLYYGSEYPHRNYPVDPEAQMFIAKNLIIG